MQGQRFDIDLENSDDEAQVPKQEHAGGPPKIAAFMSAHVQERAISRDHIQAPSAPSAQVRGFPAPKNRAHRRFKSREVRTPSREAKPNEHDHIDAENRQRLAAMSPEDIVSAQRELHGDLDSSLIQRLLAKATLDDTNEPSPGEQQEPQDIRYVPQKEPTHDSMHFPRPPIPDLDPDDPDFLQNLHKTYFASLPADPSKLAWMTESNEMHYSPNVPSLPVSSLRFSFRGHLLPPRLAAQIAVTKGLHHHGHAPDAAGYTIPELSILARSILPSQRCIAFQTLGRILYRLGRGDFGEKFSDESYGQELYSGLWAVIEKEKILDNLIDAAKDRPGTQDQGPSAVVEPDDEVPPPVPGWNRSVWAVATDAVWLWHKGGGQRLPAR